MISLFNCLVNGFLESRCVHNSDLQRIMNAPSVNIVKLGPCMEWSPGPRVLLISEHHQKQKQILASQSRCFQTKGKGQL